MDRVRLIATRAFARRSNHKVAMRSILSKDSAQEASWLLSTLIRKILRWPAALGHASGRGGHRVAAIST